MSDSGIEAVMLSVGPDMPYFTGYEATVLERLTMLVVDLTTEPVLFVPLLEAPRVQPGPFQVVPWGETEDPVALSARRVEGARRIAIGDHTWSMFLLGLQAELPEVAWSLASELTRELRITKTPAEIESLRSAAEAVDRVLARVSAEIGFSGRTEHAVARDLAQMTVEEGHETAAFAIVASGANGASPHHEPTDRVIEHGDLVVCDFGGRMHGYCSDVTRTFSVGEPDALQAEVHEAVSRANQAARDAVAPGVPCEDVDRAARKIIEEAGYGEQFIHRTGHGIGLEVHEHPYVVEGNNRPLAPGMAFSIEPGIYLPGRFGVRIEDIVVCGESEVDELNQADRALVVVG